MPPAGWSAENALPARESTYPPTAADREVTAAVEPHILYDATKRIFDLTIAFALLLLSLPLLVIAAALVFLTTGQSPLFAQRRVGWRGREFSMLKLRTMRAQHEPEDEFAAEEDVFVIKEPSDPRVTGIGRFLRRSSIDELPQLLNVLAGQMSLVGPRPSLPGEVARYPRSWLRRFGVKPGLSGLWQVSGRSAVPPRRRMAIDRRYLRDRSLALDLAIMLRTVSAILSRRGAW